jgi:hypothetical protein
MEKEFVPYELAVKLKALGFDKKCIATIDQTNYIHIKGTRRPIRGAMVYNTIDCPTFSQAFRWFREEYGYWSYVKEATKGTCRFYIEKFDEKFFNSDIIDTYEEAELACLEKLIEIVKNK